LRTDTKLAELVHALQGNCGDLYDACRQCAVSLIFVRTWMKDDKDVHAAIVEAERVGALALQSAAIQRAVHGVEKGVYFKGERVDTEIQYSDGLLTTLLKGRLPEVFGKEAEGGLSIAGNNVQVNIMPRANSYDEWLAMRDSTLNKRDIADKTDANMIDVTPEPVPEGRHMLLPYPQPSAFEGLGL
jgi:hypothetical protein